MTCGPIPMQPLDALYQAARKYPGGIAALAARLHLTEETMRKKLRVQVDSHRLTYDELSEVLFCLEEAHVEGWDSTLHALAWRHGGVFLRLPKAAVEDDDAMLASITDSVKEHAEAVAAIGASLAPDRDGKRRIDPREMRFIEEQTEQAVAAILAMRDHARRRHEADFPAAAGKGYDAH